jgi:hypothetical protein
MAAAVTPDLAPVSMPVPARFVPHCAVCHRPVERVTAEWHFDEATRDGGWRRGFRLIIVECHGERRERRG